ncbi:MAG: hypothetical protein D6702_04345 [Planctomycetota bacterium]|nr:MAG: hypothetical protein D6702_04345 [Planctomycetota bacterium]
MKATRFLPPLLLLLGCAAPAPLPPPPAVDLGPVWAPWWRGDEDAALAAAEERGWERAGSVAGERLRQMLRSRRGERPALVAEVRRWRRDAPEDPDLAYLEARLIQDPARAEERFRALARRFPRHPWIGLGLASLVEGGGAPPRVVRSLLEAVPERADAAPFRRQIEARLLAREDRPRAALARLEEDAFVRGDRAALETWLGIAARAGLRAEEERGKAEVRRRALGLDVPLGARVATIGRRAVAEARARPGMGLAEFLALLDGWCGEAGLRSGWAEAPRYRLGPVGSLVRPEAGSSPPAAEWAEAGRTLLVGSAWGHGLEVLLLEGVERHRLRWPGRSEPLEILIARRGRGSRANGATGGTIFGGFYLRLDLLAAAAAALEDRLDRVRPLPEVPNLPPPLEPVEEDGRLPEDWDLDLRLGARCRADSGRSARELEFELLLLHEAGHLAEVLPLLDGGRRLWPALPAALASWLRSGDPMTWLEERAGLRALAASPHPRWALADLVRGAHSGPPRYRSAYRRVLGELIEAATAADLPPFWAWDRLEPGRLRALAERVLAGRGLAPLPAEGVEALLALPLPAAPAADG